VEFEQILTAEQLERNRPKLGQPKVRRIPDSNDYVYEFRRIDHPMRFRVLAGDAVTPWYTIEVKPLPKLRRLVRTQEEPGYLHGSNARVRTGPFEVSLEGEESRFDIRAGARLTLDGESHKPLRWVRVALQGQSGHSLWSKVAGYGLGVPGPALGTPGWGGALDLAAGWGLIHHLETQNPYLAALQLADPHTFRFRLKEIANADLRLRLEFEDTDGIEGQRRLVITATPDKEPEFVHLTFEGVRREMITAKAIIPFTGRIRDDHGLLGLAYEAKVLRPDSSVVAEKTYPFLNFVPLRVSETGRENLQFERLGQVTFGRLLSSPREQGKVRYAWGDLAGAQLGLARLPAASLWAWHQMPGFEIPREHLFEYRARSGGEQPWGPGDEYLDTALLRRSDAADELADKPSVEALTPPYRLVIRVVARDNHVGSDGQGQPVPASQEGRNSEAFEFTVVAEEDVLIAAGQREVELRDRCEAIVGNLRKGSELLKRLRAEFDTLETADDYRRAVNDCQDVLKAVREGRDVIEREVVRDFRQIFRELWLNQCREEALKHIDGKICRPLETLLQSGEQFDKTEDAVDALAKRIEAEKGQTPPPALANPVTQIDLLIYRLEQVLNEMKRLIEFNQALAKLKEVIEKQAEINKLLQKLEKEKKKGELQDELGDPVPKKKPD
jgi:hypothetical protein